MRALEELAEHDAKELRELRARAASASSWRPHPVAGPSQRRAVLRRTLQVLGFAAGAAVTYLTVVHEFGWHWAFAGLLAPLGGGVVVLLGEMGATI